MADFPPPFTTMESGFAAAYRRDPESVIWIGGSFQPETFVFNNFKMFNFKEGGDTWSCMEHFYQTRKYQWLLNHTTDPRAINVLEDVIHCITSVKRQPSTVKNISSAIDPFVEDMLGEDVLVEWGNDESIKCMMRGLRAKFSGQNEVSKEAREKLKETHPKLLAESVKGKSSRWGVNRDTLLGANLLGQLLVSLRKEIMDEDRT